MEIENRGRGRGAVTLLLGVAVGALAMLVVARQAASSWSSVARHLLGRTTQVDVSQPTVVNKIQQLQRLETVVYTMDKVVSGEKENAVVAGVDFGGLKSGDVVVEGRKVRLRLPSAQVFATRLDNARTRVYSRQTGLLVPVDPNLETQVRQEGERQLLQAALQDGVLKTANQNARATLKRLLQGLGFDRVELE